MSSPRDRRLNSDFRAMQSLRDESTIIEFDSRGNPPTRYRIVFQGKGVWKPMGVDEVQLGHRHEVLITLNSAYPRMMPELAWQTPVFHPNISASGVVCLGGYGTHWVPSLKLDELCNMLWDMIRFKNFDVMSPYNREAAIWAKNQTKLEFPLDSRPLRNRVSGDLFETEGGLPPVVTDGGIDNSGIQIIEAEIVEAEILPGQNVSNPSLPAQDDGDIVFFD